MSSIYEELRDHFTEITNLEKTVDLLRWDADVYMPNLGYGERREQINTLDSTIEELLLSSKTAQLLDHASRSATFPTSEEAQALLRLCTRKFQHCKSLSSSKRAEIDALRYDARQDWDAAKSSCDPDEDFTPFVRAIEKCLDAERTLAEAIGYERYPYDALLDQNEPGLTAMYVDPIFEGYSAQIEPFAQNIIDSLPATSSKGPPPLIAGSKMRVFIKKFFTDSGFDFSKGRIDSQRKDGSKRPYCLSLSSTDTRIVLPDIEETFQFIDIFVLLHEMGHAIHNQGIPWNLQSTPIGRVKAVVVSESQSLIWEDFVGRDLPFWDKYYAQVNSLCNGQLPYASSYECYRAANYVAPGMNSFTLHSSINYDLNLIMRYEFERDLVNKVVSAKDLPNLWNARSMRVYNRPVSIAEFVHRLDAGWFFGGFGKEMLYVLGRIFAGQIWRHVQQDEHIRDSISNGEFYPLTAWLGNNIHRFGHIYPLSDLAKKCTNDPLSPKPYADFLIEKLTSLYMK